MLATILLLGLMLLATVTELARHKVYNWTTYTGMLAALGLSAAGLLVLDGTRISFLESLLGLLACGLVMLVCFAMFKVGGGDVKLIAMLGAFLGPDQGITAMLWTFVLGGCVGLIVLIWRVGPLRLVVRVLRQILWSLRLRRWSPLSESERAQLEPPLLLAPSALAAVVIVRFSLMDFLM
jgi:prepilin peptidase CpaA